MKDSLLEILRCPSCKSGGFFLENAEGDSLEIRKGRAGCGSCGAFYPIEDGVINFLGNACGRAIRERNAMDMDEYITDESGNKYKVTPETIRKFKDIFLLLPEGDGSYFFKRGGSFQSIAEASDRFYSTLDYMRLQGTERLLEIGACFSYASFKFAKKGCRVTALDVSNYLKAADLFIKDAYFDRIFSDMHFMPFTDESFDIVFGSAVLHHSKDLAGVFGEIKRILRPGGRVILINESARGAFEKVHPVFEEMDKKGFGDTAYTLLEWKRGARKGGFKKIKIEFLSLARDYITRHRNRGSRQGMKFAFACFIKNSGYLENFLLFLLAPLRLFFRPKSWRMVCYK